MTVTKQPKGGRVSIRFTDAELARIDRAIRKAGPEMDRSAYVREAVRMRLKADAPEVKSIPPR